MNCQTIIILYNTPYFSHVKKNENVTFKTQSGCKQNLKIKNNKQKLKIIIIKYIFFFL